MAAPAAIGTHSRQSGVWELIDNVETRVSDVWTPLQKIHTRVGGVWKVVFVDPTEEIQSGGNQVIRSWDYSDSPWLTTSRYTMYVDGQASMLRTPSPGGGEVYVTNWKAYEYGRDCEVSYAIVTHGSGTLSTNPSMNKGEWYDIDETLRYQHQGSGGGISSFVLVLTVRNKAVGAASEKTRQITLTNENGLF